jgi:hypothetical protein
MNYPDESTSLLGERSSESDKVTDADNPVVFANIFDDSMASYGKKKPWLDSISVIPPIPSFSAWCQRSVLIFIIICSASYLSWFAYSAVFNSNAIVVSSDDITSADISYLVYKFTTSVSNGTSTSVRSYSESYLAYTDDEISLGCTTKKSVAYLLNDFAIHWVDSIIYPISGKTITELAEYIKSLSMGTESFNSYMHNKLQMYTSDLQPLYDILSSSDDVLTAFYRLSTTSNATRSYNLAHISILIPDTLTIYEVLGPSDSLDDETLSAFTAWSDDECPIAHELPYSLDYYDDRYQLAYESQSTSLADWTTSSGLSSAIKVQVTIPTQSIDYINSTIQFVHEITNGTVTFGSSSDGMCNILSIQIGDMTVKYVANDAISSDLEYTIADWEADVEESHEEFVADSNDWDRYLDSHIGVMFGTADTCTSNFERVVDVVERYGNSEWQYSIRAGHIRGNNYSTHIYVGTPGLRSWEFHLNDCVYDYPHICGCVAVNRDDAFYIDGILASCSNVNN